MPATADDTDEGFSTAEKVVGAVAAYRAPLTSGIVASAMARNETDPVRKRQLTTLRNAALTWWIVGIVVAIIAIGVGLGIATSSSSSSSGSSCRGGIDHFSPPTYRSIDGKHWTATYPCTKGGSKTVPVPRREVPGEGR